MSLIFFILIVVLVFVGVWLFRAFRRVRRIYRMLFYGEMPRQERNNGARRSSGAHNSTRTRTKSKVFSPQDGEYVEFEEIKVSSSQTVDTSSASYAAEEQVEDAEWEDIKS